MDNVKNSTLHKEKVILEVRKVSKTFPGVQALKDVNLKILDGEVHALVGENGAGKSTLMKILSGIYRPDEGGEIFFKDRKVTIANPHFALRLGISMIHQELNLVPQRTVAENIWIGREPVLPNVRLLDWNSLFKKTRDLLTKIDISILEKEKVENLNIASQQLVEISKAVSYNPKLIIMDEPTSSLTRYEVEKLFRLIRNLKKNGVSVIYISHILDEIFEVADRVSVLRDGQLINTKNVKDLKKNEIVAMMVGRSINIAFPKLNKPKEEIAFEVRNLNKKNVLKDISFKVKKGEIVGIAGLIGAKRTDVAKAIFGIDSLDSGEIFIEEKKNNIKSSKDAISLGIAMVPEDRKSSGLALCRSLKENLSIANLDSYSKGLFIIQKKEKINIKKLIKRLSIKATSMGQIVNYLSGGNQQKVVIAKWLSTNPKILILDEPTRGIDVNAKLEIHKLMVRLAEKGIAIIMISSEMLEVLGMSHRVIVMKAGKIQKILDKEEITQEVVLSYAMGEKSSND